MRYNSAISKSLILTIALTVFLTACSSRYRLDLYLTADQERKKAEIEGTELVKDAVFEKTENGLELRPDEGHVAIIVAGRRGKKIETGLQYALAFDQNLRVKLYLQLPPKLEPASFDLRGHSAAQLLEHFDQSPAQKLYSPSDGIFRIDSLKKSMLYLTVDGEFKNSEQKSIGLDGQFKMRIRD